MRGRNATVGCAPLGALLVAVVSVVFEFWLPGSWRPAVAVALGARSVCAFTILSPKSPLVPFGTGYVFETSPTPL